MTETYKQEGSFLLLGGGGGAREGEDGDFLILMFPSYFQPVLTCSK
jgi:hypothetical protein